MSMRDADKPIQTDRDLALNDMMHAHVNSLNERSTQNVGTGSAKRTSPIEAMFDAEGRLEGAVEELVSLIDHLLGEPSEAMVAERTPAGSVLELLTDTPQRMDNLGSAITVATTRLRSAFL